MSTGNGLASEPTPAQRLGQTMRQLRMRAGLSQAGLAVEAGVSVGTISNIEGDVGDHATMPDTYWLLRLALLKRLGPSKLQPLEDAWSALVAAQQPTSMASDPTAEQRAHEMPRPEKHEPAVHTASDSTVGTINYYVNQPIDQSVSRPTATTRQRFGRRGAAIAGGGTLILVCLLALSLSPLARTQARGIRNHPASSTAATGGDALTGGMEGLQLTLDGWAFRTVPYGPFGGEQARGELGSAIAAHNTRTGAEWQILTPQPGYIGYYAALWSPTLHQLFYIAQSTSGYHEVWQTPLTDNGPAQPPSPSGERPFFQDCGPTCSGLAWSADGLWLIFEGPKGPLAELNLMTAQQRPLAQAGG